MLARFRLATQRHRTVSLTNSAPVSLPRRTFSSPSSLLARPSTSSLSRSSIAPCHQLLRRNIMTISDPASYRPNAPSPFIVSPSPPLEQPLAGYERVEAKDGSPGYAVFKGKLEQSPNDDRQYRLIMLENGLEALVICDPKTDKAAAAMDVKVGHLSDPEDLQGLAHFCEHLMFMGTEKYPKENDYTEFLTQHSGSSNAFTGMDQTCYFFDVSPTSLEPALDRFAQFFISPLFDPSCSEREANAVHSENSKNLQSDMWRLFQLDKSTSSREHVFWRFGTGNKETLWDEPLSRGVDVRARLIEWCEKHYSANLCKLVVLSKESLDATTKLIVEQFSAVPNRHLPPPDFPGSPLTSNELGRTMFVKSVRDTRMLDLSFPFPDESAWYASKPGSFLSHLIGHEGQGSILSVLKEKGWANGMSAGAGNGASGFEFFRIQVDLTQEGLDNYEDVVSCIFAFITLLRTHPPAEWAFLEVAALSKLAFRFKEQSPPSSTASNLSMSMSKPYPREKLLSAPWICSEWHPAQVNELLDLMKPEKCRITVAAQKEIGGRIYGEREKWYGTEYTIERTSDKILQSTKTATDYPGLALPRPNKFVPQDLEIKDKVEVAEPSKRPTNLSNTPLTRLWHKKDDRWWVPRASTFFLFRSPLVDDTVVHSVQSRLFTELIRDSLNEYAYDAELAGLSYSFDQQADGILLSVDGYNDKLPVLVEVIVKRMKEYQVDEKRFSIIVDQLRRLYVNFRLEEPYQHVGIDGNHLSQAISYKVDQKLAALDHITPQNLQEHIAALLSRMHIEALVHGNMVKEEAVALSKIVEETIAPKPLRPEELKSHQALVIPEGKYLTRRPVANPENANSAVEQFTYIGDILDDLLRVKLSLFGTIVSEPLFDILRAREQLGYIVSSGPRKSIRFMGLRVIVQSERDALHVESRIDAFWEEFKKTLDEMKEEEFEKYKTAVASKKVEDHKNMWQESSSLWLNIHCGWYDFEQRWRDAELVKTLTKSDMVDFFRTYFFDSPAHRIRRVSIHVDSQRLTPEQCATLGPVIASMDVPVDPAQMTQLATSRPTTEQAKAFAEKHLRAHGKGDEEVQKLQEEIEKLRAKPVPEGYELIEDQDEWRAKQERAPHALPVKEYADLFPAKL
ncbi:hypothetical protein JCM5296_001752 [Sporobolomyces johnsonii]